MSGQIVLLILALIGFFLIATYFVTVKDWSTSVTDSSLCTQSIAAARAVRDKTEGFASFERLTCPARHTDFEGAQEEVMRAIADDITNCWVKVGRNGFDLGKRVFLLDRTSPDKNVCLVCSTFTVAERVSVRELVSYMENAPVAVNTERTYDDALNTGFGGDSGSSLWGIFQNKQTYADGQYHEVYGHPDDLKSGYVKAPEYLRNAPSTYYIVAVNPAGEHHHSYSHVVVIEEGRDLDHLSCHEFRYQPAGKRATEGSYD